MSDTKNYNTPKILTMIDEDDHLNMNFRNPDVFFFFFSLNLNWTQKVSSCLNSGLVYGPSPNRQDGARIHYHFQSESV